MISYDQIQKNTKGKLNITQSNLNINFFTGGKTDFVNATKLGGL